MWFHAREIIFQFSISISLSTRNDRYHFPVFEQRLRSRIHSKYGAIYRQWITLSAVKYKICVYLFRSTIKVRRFQRNNSYVISHHNSNRNSANPKQNVTRNSIECVRSFSRLQKWLKKKKKMKNCCCVNHLNCVRFHCVPSEQRFYLFIHL